MTVQQIVDGARALSCCIPSGLQRSSVVFVLNQLLSGAGGREGVSLLSGLYDHWSFDGTMVGVNGHVFSNASTVYGAGLVYPQALELDGTTNTVARALDTANDLQIGEYYVCGIAWTNFDSVAASSGIVSKRNTASTTGPTIELNGARYRLLIGGNAFTEATVMIAGAWHMVAFNAIKNGVDTAFVSTDDGTSNASGIPTANAVALVNPLTVGQRANLVGAIMDGRIGALTIWQNRQLSLADISYLYNGGVGRRYPFFV